MVCRGKCGPFKEYTRGRNQSVYEEHNVCRSCPAYFSKKELFCLCCGNRLNQWPKKNKNGMKQKLKSKH